MSDIEKKLEELMFNRLRIRAKARATSLRAEARGYWHTNRERFHELKARSAKFDDFAELIKEMVDNLPAYPAKPEVTP